MTYRYKGKKAMLKKVESYVTKWHMIEKGERILVGVSGGADSVCLLFVLSEIQKKLPFELVAVHVNHGLRGDEADEDEKFVKTLCNRLMIPCDVYHYQISQIAKERKMTEEEAGRMMRWQAFRESKKRHGATKIALAHHMNDNAETFFLNVARGTGIKGIGGMCPVKEDRIRPFLCVKRDEIEKYLVRHGIDYREDATNATDEYARNRVRNHIIPYLEEHINSSSIEHIAETMERLRNLQNFLDEQVKIYSELCVKEVETGYILNKERFEQAPMTLRPWILKDFLVKAARREKDIEAVHVQILEELLQRQVGRKVNLPYGLVAKRVYEGILVREEIDLPNIDEEGLQVQCRVFERVETKLNLREKSNTKWFDYDIISDEICVRTRQAGDYITIHQDGRRQKLKAFFINEKIPEEERDHILLVADGSHILWIVGYRDNPVYRVHRETKKILEIQINKGEENDGRDN